MSQVVECTCVREVEVLSDCNDITLSLHTPWIMGMKGARRSVHSL